MKIIETMIDIDAPIDAVWNILTDFSRMGDWNPFIKEMKGEARRGAQLKFKIALSGKPSMPIAATVLTVSAPHELRWRGSLGAAAIFSGEHYFTLSSPDARRTRLTHGEKFSGLLAQLVMRGALLQTSTKGFQDMNEALKKRCEASYRERSAG